MGSAIFGGVPEFLAKQLQSKLGLPKHLIDDVDGC